MSGDEQEQEEYRRLRIDKKEEAGVQHRET